MGTYKPQLDLKGLYDLRRRLKGAESSQIDIGHIKPKWRLKDALYQAELAYIHHEGVRDSKGGWRTPPRPYLVKGLERLAKDTKFWKSLGQVVMKGSLNGNSYQLNKLLKNYGAKARDAIKKSVKHDTLGLARNKPSTILRKQSTVPMVDTQELVDDIKFRIVSRKPNTSKMTRLRRY